MGKDRGDVSVNVWNYRGMSGYLDGCFGKKDYLKREQMVVTLINTENWIARNYYEWEGLK